MQGWTTTQLGNYVTLNTEQTIAKKKTFNNTIVHRNLSGVNDYQPALEIRPSYFTEANRQNVLSNGGELAICAITSHTPDDKTNFIISNLYKKTTNELVFYLYKSDYSDRPSFRFVNNNETGESYLLAPSPTIGKELSGAVINYAYLNNTSNNVVHKTGNEDNINGRKTFLYDLCLKDTTRGNVIYQSFDFSNFKRDELTENEISASYVCHIRGNDASRFVETAFTRNTKTGLQYYHIFNYNYNVEEFGLELISQYDGDHCVQIKKADFTPSISNTYSLGRAAKLWSEVYAGNGTIQTSDKRVKTNIQEIPEKVLKAWGKVNFKLFKFKDAVEKKGSSARTHVGLIANENVDSVVEAFKSEGLDARDYGLFCWDSWEDVYEEKKIVDSEIVVEQVKVVDKEERVEGNETIPEEFHYEDKVVKPEVSHIERTLVIPAGERYSLRYEQCLCLECAYQRWKLEQFETHLAALEAKVK